MIRRSRVGHRFARVWSVSTPIMLLFVAACGSSPTAPTPVTPPPTPVPPKLVCPSDMTATSPNDNPLSVDFSVAVQSGTGAAPVNVVCTPPAGTQFPLGTTTVECKATDARQQTDSCAFWVTVVPPPRLSVTRIVAFGDSITEGKGGSRPYPARLQDLLAARYTNQPITVINEGLGGEATVTGQYRLNTVLSADRPDLVILDEGTNDLIAYGQTFEGTLVANLRTMVRGIRNRGARVIIATLTPQRPNSAHGWVPELIAPTNDLIKAMAATEGATVVDIFNAFGGTADPYISDDGLHPNDAGYQKMAENFYNAIQGQFELRVSDERPLTLARVPLK